MSYVASSRESNCKLNFFDWTQLEPPRARNAVAVGMEGSAPAGGVGAAGVGRLRHLAGGVIDVCDQGGKSFEFFFFFSEAALLMSDMFLAFELRCRSVAAL